jgi:thioredoxin 2
MPLIARARPIARPASAAHLVPGIGESADHPVSEAATQFEAQAGLARVVLGDGRGEEDTMIWVCEACGRKNRVPAAKLAAQGRCGACGAEIRPLDAPLDVDVTQFDEIASGAPVPILVDFWAEWCGPCRMAAPAVKQVAKEVSGRALVLKVNTERFPELSQRYAVRAIPNFVVLHRGRVVRQEAGLADARTMAQWLEDART